MVSRQALDPGREDGWRTDRDVRGSTRTIRTRWRFRSSSPLDSTDRLWAAASRRGLSIPQVVREAVMKRLQTGQARPNDEGEG